MKLITFIKHHQTYINMKSNTEKLWVHRPFFYDKIKILNIILRRKINVCRVFQ